MSHALDLRELGRSGIKVSAAGLGGGTTSRFGLAHGGTPEDVRTLIDRAIDLGITLFDSSGAISGTDEPLAEALGHRRHDVILSTKVHVGPFVPRLPGRLSTHINRVSARLAAETAALLASPGTLANRVDRALASLGRDHIDILSLHAVPPEQFPKVRDRLVPALLRLKEEGKIRALGVSESLRKDPGHRTLEMTLDASFADVIMVGLGPLRRHAVDTILPRARRAGVGVLAMAAARGGMTGPEALKRWLEANASLTAAEAATLTAKLIAELDRRCASGLPGAAYRHAFAQDGVSSLLIGTTSPRHLERNLDALSCRGLADFDPGEWLAQATAGLGPSP